MNYIEDSIVSKRSIETCAFLVGVVLLFTLKTTLETLFPASKPTISDMQYFIFNVLLSILVNLIIGIATRWINARLEQRIPWYTKVSKRLIIQTLWIAFFVLVMVSFFWTIILFILPYEDPLLPLKRGIIIGSLISIVLSMFYTGVYFFEQWGRSRLDAEKLKGEILHSQIVTLKNQVSPHFLFNSLNTLSNLISEDQNRATEFVLKLASVYRYVLQSLDSELVDLETELTAMRAYAYLQQTRFGDSLKINVHIPDRCKQMYTAPFTLQILLENAIKHNIISKAKPLTVDIFVEDDTTLIVKNNLQRKSSVQYGTGVGLKNIASRYALLDKKIVEFRETKSEFTIALPLLENN